jgi:hypothetical protein
MSHATDCPSIIGVWADKAWEQGTRPAKDYTQLYQ